MIYLLRHWKPLALVLLIAGLVSAGYAWKSHNAAQAAELAEAKQEAAEWKSAADALEVTLERQQAATKAADEARDRNDTKIPEVRAASQGRVARAADPALPAADQLQDDRAALEGYGAARDSLRGARPR